jgi:hypothetical protein
MFAELDDQLAAMPPLHELMKDMPLLDELLKSIPQLNTVSLKSPEPQKKRQGTARSQKRGRH